MEGGEGTGREGRNRIDGGVRGRDWRDRRK